MTTGRRFIPPPPGVRRRVSFDRCDRCGVLIGRGLDADVAALSVRVDPMLLSAFGETQVLRLSMHVATYDLIERRLDHRDEWARRTRPAGEVNAVLAGHLCWIPFPEAWRQRTRAAVLRPYPDHPDPPF